jgi:hypothetical protein
VGALYDVNNFIMLAARVPQILKNFSEQSTGQLSIVTFGVNTVGCVVRILTSLHEGAHAMVRSYILGEAPPRGGGTVRGGTEGGLANAGPLPSLATVAHAPLG